ncbi:3-hydroxybutyryl-CoA dehydrogenase [Sphingobacterium nematocida]|uniref:3-hydroxybutyryl-CoA dehydrogenase n=1 Tax=Sphingobacterium nematocida TaxID=1513896 RepID=A0A1T5G0C7_9SPHI|nr:3-hydroxyacyl-CoA dehydrogenase family protein [Sphingobacterium nematocida]SKC01714.1 3-hydroxybutyryl-CoA dehydrogenase [Sphingobacterium nematocida]
MRIAQNSPILVVGLGPVVLDFYEQLMADGFEVDVMAYPGTIDRKYDLIFAFTKDNLEEKVKWISSVESLVADDGLLCINIDGISLDEIQQSLNSEVIGVNFCYPVCASPFMEIITTARNKPQDIDALYDWAVGRWNKDPYIVKKGISIRAYMVAAMAREAFYLVEQGYASVESIDRACRNDAGYYLPFTGNYLYMDLMGTVAYALVMKELNSELSNSSTVPDWFSDKIEKGQGGMKDGLGLYAYNEGDDVKWNAIVREYSKEINELITKYKKEYAEG